MKITFNVQYWCVARQHCIQKWYATYTAKAVKWDFYCYHKEELPIICARHIALLETDRLPRSNDPG